MKKLLAMLLCVVLFVSAVPASAYARGGSIDGTAVNLKPAYDAMEELNKAYAKLAVATAYSNAIEGFSSIDLKTKGRREVAIRDLIGTAKNSRSAGIKAVKNGMSYEEVFALVAPAIFDAYGTVAKGVVKGIGEEIGDTHKSSSMVSGVMSSVNSIVASIG